MSHSTGSAPAAAADLGVRSCVIGCSLPFKLQLVSNFLCPLSLTVTLATSRIASSRLLPPPFLCGVSASFRCMSTQNENGRYWESVQTFHPRASGGVPPEMMAMRSRTPGRHSSGSSSPTATSPDRERTSLSQLVFTFDVKGVQKHLQKRFRSQVTSSVHSSNHRAHSLCMYDVTARVVEDIWPARCKLRVCVYCGVPVSLGSTNHLQTTVALHTNQRRLAAVCQSHATQSHGPHSDCDHPRDHTHSGTPSDCKHHHTACLSLSSCILLCSVRAMKKRRSKTFGTKSLAVRCCRRVRSRCTESCSLLPLTYR